jgi:hypothetical protein
MNINSFVEFNNLDKRIIKYDIFSKGKINLFVSDLQS